MFSDDLILDDFPRWLSNLKQSIEANKRFETFLATLGANHWRRYFWDIAESGEDFLATPFESSDKGPLAGVVRYRNWYQFDTEPIPGASFDNIPEVLRNHQQWIWLSPSQEKNANRHKPYLCRGVKEGEGLLPKNMMRFSPIDWCYANDPCGNGYVLNDTVIVDDLRLVAIEISPKSGLNNYDVKKLWIALGKPYLEYSKDCHGWTILGFVNQKLQTINCDGVKIFTGGDFVELSGLGAEGQLKDITREVLSFHAYRFPKEKSFGVCNKSPFTPAAKARLEDMLNHISADCNRSIYMRVIWGILSTGWPTAKQIALNWSLTAPHRFEQEAFDNLVNSYDPLRNDSITLGTIYHLAKNGGWRG